jgi:uncharacterized membrane-anchored protein
MTYLEMTLLAGGGYVFHLLKMYGESLKRNEEFLKKPFIVSVASNLVAIIILIYIGGTLPPDLLVMSPLTCVIIGGMASSLLSGFIAIKKPKLPDGDTN